MIEQAARVVAVEGQTLVIATESQSGCQSCNVKGGCGTALIGRLFPQRPQQQLRLPADNLPSLPRAGDRVVIGIDESYLLSSTLRLYAVPLLGLLAGAMLGAFLGNQATNPLAGEPASILLGLLGLSLGLLLNRTRARRSKAVTPWVKVLRIRPSSPVTVDLAAVVNKPRA